MLVVSRTCFPDGHWERRSQLKYCLHEAKTELEKDGFPHHSGHPVQPKGGNEKRTELT